MRLFETVTDLRRQADVIRRRRYGVIEMADERLQRIVLRPWPKKITLLELWLRGERCHSQRRGNRSWLYYNQPLGHSNFLAFTYGVSAAQTTLATVRGALVVLDEIARIKATNAIVCEVTNARISDRLLARWGWEALDAQSRRRQFIRRFYGEFQPPDEAWALMGPAVEREPVLC